jgi:hypothetical protein
MGDVRFEKIIEDLCEQVLVSRPNEGREDCPMIKLLATALRNVRDDSSGENMFEIGMLPCADLTCPCRTIKKV